MLYRANTRKVVKEILFWALLGLFLNVLLSLTASAATYKPKDAKIAPSDIFAVNVSFQVKKKTITKAVACRSTVPGRSFSKKKVLWFRSLKDDAKLLALDIKAASRNAKKLASLRKKQVELKALTKASGAACAQTPSSPPGAPPSSPPGSAPPEVVPDASFFDAYNGAFGEAEARHLLNRFGMGASISEIELAVSRGLAATVQDLLTWRSEPALEAYNRDLECDGRPPEDENNESCDASNINDLSTGGFRYSWYNGAIKSQNSLFYRTFLFLHDDFMAVNSNVLEGCERHALRTYQQMMWRVAQSGDLRDYLKSFMTDHLGALKYLNLGASRAPIPNQDFAREFWQLGSIGQTRPTTGELNYGELDIISAANVLAGWSIEGFQDPSENWVCFGAKIPGLSVPGSHIVFYGTPYQAIVNNPDELLEATLRHPSASENIALKIYQQFVNPEGASAEVIAHFARIIRESGFNLNASLRTLMLSRGFFAQQHRNSEYKHPLQLIAGFFRQTQIPFDSFWQLESIFGDLAERPYQSPSVFGWYPDRLAGEVFVLERRNALNWLVTQGDSFYQTKGFSYFDTFLQNIPTGTPPTTVIIQRVARMLGVPVNAAQIAQLDEYMNFYLTNSGCPSQCGGNPTRLVRDVFDPYRGSNNQNGNWGRQLRGLLLILASLPQYQVN